MKKIILVALAVMFSVSSAAFASEEEKTGAYGNAELLSAYVLSSGFKTYNGAVFQPEVGYIFKNGITLSAWGSLPANFRDVGTNTSTEVDFCLKKKISEWLSVTGSYYAMAPEIDSVRNDVVALIAEFSYSLGDDNLSSSLGFKAEYDFPVTGSHTKGTTGVFLHPKVDVDQKISEKVNVGLGIDFGIDLGGFGADKALVTKVAPKISYKISDKMSVYTGMDMYFPILQTHNDPREDYFIGKLGVSYKF